MDQEAPHLPDALVKRIAHYSLQGEPPGNCLINLLSMCGVCRQWRASAREVEPATCIGFDALENIFVTQAAMHRFRKLSTSQKEASFMSAARLLTGYTEVSFSGDGVTDQLLEQVASSVGSQLVKVRVHGCSAVTDEGLAALISRTTRLQCIALEDLPGAGSPPLATPSAATSCAAAAKASVAAAVAAAAASMRQQDDHQQQHDQEASTTGRRSVAHALAVHLKLIGGAPGGRFLGTLLEGCPDLHSLFLSGIPHLNWGPTKLLATCWTDKAITHLRVRGVNLDADFGLVLSKMVHLTELELDGLARNVRVAAVKCRKLQRVSYQVSCRQQLEEALCALLDSADIKQLELIIKNFTLSANCLRMIGMLPVVDLRLDSFIYKQQPTLSRSSFSHVDNQGVRGLVDAICNRWSSSSSDVASGEMQPLKLSLCGATALTHDAVSALLRLPILTGLDIGGCSRITAMDKMRLVAKVRAGREMIESGRRPSMRSSRFPGLIM